VAVEDYFRQPSVINRHHRLSATLAATAKYSPPTLNPEINFADLAARSVLAEAGQWVSKQHVRGQRTGRPAVAGRTDQLHDWLWMSALAVAEPQGAQMCVLDGPLVSIYSQMLIVTVLNQPRPALRAPVDRPPQVWKWCRLKVVNGGARRYPRRWRRINREGKTCIGELVKGKKTARIGDSSAIDVADACRGLKSGRSVKPGQFAYTAGVAARSQAADC